MTNLLPCPFCGSDHVELKIYYYGRGRVISYSPYNGPTTSQVQCDNCNSSSGDYDSKEEAIKAWNNRYNHETIDKKDNK